MTRQQQGIGRDDCTAAIPKGIIWKRIESECRSDGATRPQTGSASIHKCRCNLSIALSHHDVHGPAFIIPPDHA